MARGMWLLAPLVSAGLWVGMGGDAQAQAGAAGFRCPKPGTVVVLQNQTSSTARGPDPSDPEVCLSTNTNFGDRKSLLGFWPLPFREPSEEPAVRAAMRSILNGQKSEVTFDITTQFAGTGRQGGTATFGKITNTFRRAGTETVTIGGQPINAVVYERFEQTPNGGLTRRHYYDPASAVWVKVSDAARDGTVMIQGSAALSVTVP